MQAGADWALGVDPTLLFVMQHLAFRAATPASQVWVLPMTDDEISDMPTPQFDLVMSMGVLYHRKDAAAHIRNCFCQMRTWWAICA